MANNNLLAGITTGLSNTYKYLKSKMPDGVTYDGIMELMKDSEKSGMVNATFASYLQTNFNAVDKNGDGMITDQEMEKLTGVMAKAGLTKDELVQMYSSGVSGLSNATMEMIMKYFDEMDTNKDGRLTSAEIAAFSINSAKQERMDEYAHQRATNMSTFYGNESSSDYTGSLLSYKYKSSKD
jgi:Ca2+-binding EF-hand superfamily protein